MNDSCCAPPKAKVDYLLWGSLIVIAAVYILFLSRGIYLDVHPLLQTFSASVHELMNRMAWGIALGIVMVGLLGLMPRELVTALLGKGGTTSGILRATGAGVLLDLCSHGILMVAAKLYERGASLGQVMAFLIASPWNSFSLTLILWALVGFKWMIALLILSMLIAIISGIMFDVFVKRGILPANPNQSENHEDCSFWQHIKMSMKGAKWSPMILVRVMKEGLMGSKMVLRWIFFGVILASLIRTFVDPQVFAAYFGPSLAGLGLTVLAATLIEVCSEGSLPIAADLLTRAKAPGNAFAFLMTGVSTDYTEIMVLKDTTRSWKIAFFLPLVTVPQILVLAYFLNTLSL
jgi:uncharacterized membrane protein YraQ (UPF0718 family)